MPYICVQVSHPTPIYTFLLSTPITNMILALLWLFNAYGFMAIANSQTRGMPVIFSLYVAPEIKDPLSMLTP